MTTNDATRASAGALPALNRRNFISTMGAGALATAATSAVAAEAATQEHPWEEARRLADELAEALEKGDGCFSGPGGRWYAQIYPMSRGDYTVMFVNIKSAEGATTTNSGVPA